MNAQKTGTAEVAAGGTLVMRLALVLCTVVAAMLLASGVALAASMVGTGQADQITGTTSSDTIDARAGNDHVEGRGEGDTIHGRGGNDTLIGDGDDTSDDRSDVLYGESGADTLKGEAFSNLYYGGPGPDDIDARFADNAVEQIFGGSGNDHIHAEDGVQDTIHCGGGTDTVVDHDSPDRFPDNDCETIN